MDHISFGSLIDLLRLHLVDTATWLKPVSSLHRELKDGKCTLEVIDRRLVRRVNVVVVYCYHVKNGRKWQLYEEKRVFKNGTIRQRGYGYVSKKIRGDESPVDVAYRALKEKLGVSLIALENIGKSETKSMSTSYNGIYTIYTMHSFYVNIDDIEYKELYIKTREDKTTYFKWK